MQGVPDNDERPGSFHRVYDMVCKAWKGSIKYTGEVRDRLGAQVEGRTADGNSYQEGGDPAGIASGRGLRGQKPGDPPGGAQGPAWGTSFASLEELTAQVTELLGSQLLQQALQRQAEQPLPQPRLACRACPGPL